MLGLELGKISPFSRCLSRRIVVVANLVGLAAAGCATDSNPGDGGETTEQVETGGNDVDSSGDSETDGPADSDTTAGGEDESGAATTGEGGPDLGICALLLECARASGNVPVTPLVSAYGEQGTCWDMFEAADCHADCRAQLGALATVGNGCAECLEPRDCPNGRSCSDEGVCIECTADLDCEAPHLCGEDGNCGEGPPCERFQDCEEGQGCYESMIFGVDGKVCGQPLPDAGQVDDACEADRECAFDLICVPSGVGGRFCQIECGDGLPPCLEPAFCVPFQTPYCATPE